MNKALKNKNIMDDKDRVVFMFLQDIAAMDSERQTAIIKILQQKGVKVILNKEDKVFNIKIDKKAKGIIYDMATHGINKAIDM